VRAILKDLICAAREPSFQAVCLPHRARRLKQGRHGVASLGVTRRPPRARVKRVRNCDQWQLGSAEDKSFGSIRARAPADRVHRTGDLPRRHSVRIPPSITQQRPS